MVNKSSDINLVCMLLSSRVRNIRSEVLCRKGVPQNSTKFTKKNTSVSLVFNIVAGLRPATFSKKETPTQVFSYEFCEFLKTPFSQNTSGGCFWRVTFKNASFLKWITKFILAIFLKILKKVFSRFTKNCNN